ncbi:MAG: hypothetical protein LBC94_03465 [Desulfovibrio sp.]|jgi:phage terminase large subunit-like protein|nr:hypothetical protein [Desulfovibrio sp.]
MFSTPGGKERLGLKTERDVVDMVKEIRRKANAQNLKQGFMKTMDNRLRNFL